MEVAGRTHARLEHPSREMAGESIRDAFASLQSASDRVLGEPLALDLAGQTMRHQQLEDLATTLRECQELCRKFRGAFDARSATEVLEALKARLHGAAALHAALEAILAGRLARHAQTVEYPAWGTGRRESPGATGNTIVCEG